MNHKNPLPRTCVLAACVALASGSASAADLTVKIDNIKKDTGMVMLNVLASEAQMNGKEQSHSSMMLQPSADGVGFTLHDVPAGTWGIQVMHDENGNGELDANMMGIPKEPWAFSNNATGRFGPPKWKDVQFTISAEDSEVTQTISLNH